MICPNCGANLVDGARFCGACGTSFAPPPPPPPPAPVQQPPQYNNNYNAGYAQAPFMPRISEFNGGVLETFAAGLVASLMLTLSCGLAAPWAVTYMLKFIFQHSTIDGKKFDFDGNGAELFGQWIIWSLLTAVTCGIYSFWVTPKMLNWIMKHTHVVSE